jgi:hypothetical protein
VEDERPPRHFTGGSVRAVLFSPNRDDQATHKEAHVGMSRMRRRINRERPRGR